MVRHIDSLGRIVLPSEMRKVLNIKEEQLLEIFIEDQTIMLKKYDADKSCLLNGTSDEVQQKLWKWKRDAES